MEEENDLDGDMEFEELAGIYEFVDGYDRETAEQKAREHIDKRIVLNVALERLGPGVVNFSTD